MVIEEVTEGSVTFMDPSVGEDLNNESFIVTKEGFLEEWKGYVLLEETKAQTIDSFEEKTLSTQDTLKIRGSNFHKWLGFALNIAAIFFPVLQIPAAIFNLSVGIAEGNWVQAVAGAVQLGFAGFGDFLKSFFDGAFSAVSSTLGQIGQFFAGVFQAVTWVVGSVTNALGNVLTSLPFIGDIGINLAEAVVNTGLRLAISSGLEAIGVDSGTAGQLGFMATGLISGRLRADSFRRAGDTAGAAKAISDSLFTTTTLPQIGNLGRSMGLEGGLLSAITLSLGAINNNFVPNPNDPFSVGFEKLLSTAIMTLANFGFQKLGEDLNLDPRLTQVIGSVAGTLRGVFAPRQPDIELDPIARGVPYIDTTSYYREGNQTPIPIPVPRSDPQRTWWDGVFEFIQGHWMEAAFAATGAYYLTRPDITTPEFPGLPPPPPITEYPIPDDAVATFYQDVFTNELKQGYKRETGNGSYIIFDRKSGLAVERFSNGVTERGDFGYRTILKSDGSVALDLENPTFLAKGEIQYESSSGEKAAFKVASPDAETVSEVEAIRIDYDNLESTDIVLDPGTTIDNDYWIIDGAVEFLKLGLKVFFENGVLNKVQRADGTESSVLSSEEITQSKVFYHLLPGFQGDGSEGVPSTSIKKLKEALEREKVDSEKINLVPLFERNDLASALKVLLPLLLQGKLTDQHIQLAKDAMQWYGDADRMFEGLTSEVRMKLKAIFSQLNPANTHHKNIAVAYSGSTNPLLKAIAQDSELTIDTVISYAGPLLKPPSFGSNSSLKTFVNVWGSADEHASLFDMLGAKFGKQDLGPNVKTVNIKILDAQHNDFWYSDDKWTGKNDPVGERVNRLTSEFVSDLIAFNETGRDVDQFFLRGGIELVDGVYTVNLEAYFSNV